MTPSESWFDALRRIDDARESFPGEHWLVGATGAYLMLRGGRGSTLGRVASVALGGALLVRAASGRDGLLAWLAQRREPAEGALPPPDGGASPAWPDDGEAEGRNALDQLARARDTVHP